MEFPFAGRQMLRIPLIQKGFRVGRPHVATPMERMGVEALYRKPNTCRREIEKVKPSPGHKIWPYLLRKLPITRPDQVWAMDITYIPMAPCWIGSRGLGSGMAVSITLEADFCIEAVEEALARDGAPEIFNSDQGSQFDRVHQGAGSERDQDQHGRQRGLARLRIVGRLWRTIRYEEVDLRVYASVPKARASIGR